MVISLAIIFFLS